MSTCVDVGGFIESKTSVVQTSNVGFTSDVSDYLVVHTGPGVLESPQRLAAPVSECCNCSASMWQHVKLSDLKHIFPPSCSFTRLLSRNPLSVFEIPEAVHRCQGKSMWWHSSARRRKIASNFDINVTKMVEWMVNWRQKGTSYTFSGGTTQLLLSFR